MKSLSFAAHTAWRTATWEAAASSYEFIEPEHLIIGIMSLKKLVAAPIDKTGLDLDQLQLLKLEAAALSDVLSPLNIGMTAARRTLRKKLGQGGFAGDREVVHRSPACKAFFKNADALFDEDGEITSLHLLAAILGESTPTNVELFFDPLGLKQKLLDRTKRHFNLPAEDECNSNTHPFLDKFGRDLTAAARNGTFGPFVGRRNELLQVIQTLARASKNNPVLVGEPGVGKTAIVEALAVRIVAGKAPNFIRNSRIVELNMGALVAGTSYRGEFEERLSGIIREATQEKDIILFIDEIHTLIGTGKVGGSMDAAQILKPALARGNFYCIGATTLTEYRKHVESDPALERRFDVVIVDEPSRDECIDMLRGLKQKLEAHHGCSIATDAIVSAVDLSIRFDNDHRLPDKAIDLLDRAGARQQAPYLSMTGNPSEIGTITAEAIATVLSAKIGVPVDIIEGQLGDSYKARLQGLAARLKSRIIGQDEVVDTLALRLLMAYSGISPRKGPLGVFLFMGPSGVGKTELAKALAFELFRSENSIIRLDMSEYCEGHSISKLIGSPPGYVGYQEDGQLTGKLRTKPYSILLLDEAEKAHPKVYDTFLQLFDEGRITDAKGRTVDATNCIVILTSNIRPSEQKKLGFGAKTDSVVSGDIPALKEYFRPELLNRIDEKLLFRSLGKEDALCILEPMVSEIVNSMESRHSISLLVDEQVKAFLVDVGYSSEYGARELRRAVERLLEAKLAGRLLDGHEQYDTTWKVYLENGELCLLS